MKKSNFIPATFLMSVMCLVTAIPTLAQIELNTGKSAGVTESNIVLHEGQFVQYTVEEPTEDRLIDLVNPTDLAGDLDVVAFDKDGNELDRSTIEFEPGAKMSVKFSEVFTAIKLADISKIDVSASLRPRALVGQMAASLPIMFFSQLDSRWANQRLGTSGKTIKQIGCAMTSVTMAAASKMSNLNPGTMNTYLSTPSVGGYTSSGALYWAKPPNYQPSSGFRFVGSSVNGVSTVKSAAFLKSLVDGGNYVVATSSRFDEHWVVIYKYNGTGSRLSDFEYLDPADSGYVRRTVDDGKVKSTSQIRVYK